MANAPTKRNATEISTGTRSYLNAEKRARLNSDVSLPNPMPQWSVGDIGAGIPPHARLRYWAMTRPMGYPQNRLGVFPAGCFTRGIEDEGRRRCSKPAWNFRHVTSASDVTPPESLSERGAIESRAGQRGRAPSIHAAGAPEPCCGGNHSGRHGQSIGPISCSDHLTISTIYFSSYSISHTVSNSYGASVMTIPRIIHRVVPRTQTPLMQSCWDSVKRHAPDFQHLTHFDDGAYEIVSPYLSLCEQGAFKADLIRLEVLYRYGGIYVDSDVELFRSLDPLLDLDAFAVLENDSYPVNTVMGASVNNSAIHAMLQLSCRLVHQGRLKYPYLFYNSAGKAFAFGPFAVSEALITHPGLTLLPSSDFLTYYKSTDSLSKNVGSNAYGQHHYAASWQPGGELFKTSWKIYSRMKLTDIKRRIGLLLTSLRFR